jgi:hypothetical protein
MKTNPAHPFSVPVPEALFARLAAPGASRPGRGGLGAGDAALARALVRAARSWYASASARARGAGRSAMPNQPSIHKRVLSLQIPRDLFYAVRQAAEEHRLDMAVYIRMLLTEATMDVELTPESLAAIRRETAAAKSRRSSGGTKAGRRARPKEAGA